MREKGDVFSIITAVLTLAVLGYVLFISVFNQIVAQNEGFFYMIVFGGILVLAFLLLSLMTRLFAISNEFEDRKLWHVLEAVVLVLLAIFFIRSRLSYTSSLPAEETVFYRTAVLMNKQTLSVAGMDLIPQLMRNPAQYAYAAVVAAVFSRTGSDPSVVVYINSAILLLTVFFVYRIVRRIAGRVCGVLSVACSLLMPSQAFTVYTYGTELFFACILFFSLDIFVYFLNRKKTGKISSVFLDLLLGLLFGILLFTEPAAVLIVILLLLIQVKSGKRRWISGIVTTVVMLSVFMLCFFAKSNQMECTNTELWQAYGGRFTVSSNIETGEQYDVSQIMDEFHASFASQNTAIMDNYYFLTKNNGQTYSTLQAAWFQLGNQLFYMFFIVLAIACVFYLLLGNNQKILPCMLALLGSMGVLFFGTNKENNTYFFVELLIMLGCSSLYYMYEAHYPAKEVPAEEILEEASVSPEEAETEDTRTEEEKEAELLRARALIFIGENEELYYEIKRQENPNGILKTPEYYMNRKAEESMSCEHEFVKKEVKFIENPLPLPKKHVAKTMEYGFEPDENMDFDYDIKEDDDFDI